MSSQDTIPYYGNSSLIRHLEKLVLEGHLRLGLEAHAGTEDVRQSRPLLAEGVDNRRSRRRQGGLEHVAQDAEHGVEALVLGGGGAVRRDSLPRHARHQLGDDAEINDQRRGEEGILADVEEPGSRVSTWKR